jgi:transposase
VLTFSPTVKVFLAPGRTDMRKSFDTLAGAVRGILQHDPLSGHLFVFCGRRRNLVKILLWDGSGFWLFAKRLAKGTFAWPGALPPGAQAVELRPEELTALLGGLELSSASWRSWWRRQPTGGIAS